MPELISRYICHKTLVDRKASRYSVVCFVCDRKMSAEAMKIFLNYNMFAGEDTQVEICGAYVVE